MLRIVLAAALVLASAGAYAQFNKCGHGFCPNGDFAKGFQPPGTAIVSGNNRLLLTDGASFLLQTDGASKVCLAGGC